LRLVASSSRSVAIVTAPSRSQIEVSTEGPVAEILLNRPERLNAWNDQFGNELREAILTDAADPSIRARRRTRVRSTALRRSC